jgi:hypothetical protein
MAIAIVDDTPLNLTLIQALVRKLTPAGTEIVMLHVAQGKGSSGAAPTSPTWSSSIT